MQVKQKRVPDSNHLLGQRRHFVGSFVGPTSTNDVSPMSICLSCRRNCLNLTLKQLLLNSKILKHVHIRILYSHQNSFGGNPGYIISYHCPLMGVIDNQIRDGPSELKHCVTLMVARQRSARATEHRCNFCSPWTMVTSPYEKLCVGLLLPMSVKNWTCKI